MTLEAEQNKDDEEVDLDGIIEAEQLKVDGAEEVKGPEFTVREQKAYDQGWRPEEDFKGGEGEWKTAGEYIRDGEYIDQIKQLRKEITQKSDDFDKRLVNTNKLQEARRVSEVKALRAELKENSYQLLSVYLIFNKKTNKTLVLGHKVSINVNLT